jgi:hypothetical protein
MKGCNQVSRKIRLAVAVAGLSLLLGACGGGSGSTSTSVADDLGTVDTAPTTVGTSPTTVAAQRVGSASLSWRAPAERVDGESLPMTEIAGYRIYYGTSSGQYDFQAPNVDAYTSSITIDDLPVGTYYFVMTTVDVNGLESGYSSEAVKVVQS